MAKNASKSKKSELDPAVAEVRKELEEAASAVRTEFQVLQETVSNVLNGIDDGSDEAAKEEALALKTSFNLLDNLSRRLENDLGTIESVDAFNPAPVPLEQLDALVPKSAQFIAQYEADMAAERAEAEAKAGPKDNNGENVQPEGTDDGDAPVASGDGNDGVAEGPGGEEDTPVAKDVEPNTLGGAATEEDNSDGVMVEGNDEASSLIDGKGSGGSEVDEDGFLHVSTASSPKVVGGGGEDEGSDTWSMVEVEPNEGGQ